MNIKESTRLIGIKLGSKYGVLNEQFIQFDPHFKIDLLSIEGRDEINIKYNKEDITDFFGKRVGYISGIVGKNGVGKSTLIRYIKDLFLKESYDLLDRENDIILFLEGGTIYAYGNEKYKHRLSFGYNETGFDLELIYYRKYPKIYDRLKHFTTVFYSNSLDQSEKESETTNFFNISTNFLRENIGKINKNLRNKKIRNQSGARRFRFLELMRQIEFINALSNVESTLEIPFKSIKTVTVKVDPVKVIDYRRIILGIQQSLNSDEISSNYREYMEQLSRRIMDFSKQMDYRSKRERDKGSAMFFNLFENYNLFLLKTFVSIKNIFHRDDVGPQAFDLLLEESFHEFSLIETQGRLEDRSRNLLQILRNFAQEQSNIEIDEKIFSQLKDGEKFLNHLFRLISDTDNTSDPLEIFTHEPRLGEFLKDFFGNTYDFPFLNFSWANLSAGETSLIAFFSRLYSISEDIRSENILLLIDEGDLYFHPEWQRDYIYFVLQFLNNMIPVNKRSSIILTTHSPFLLSDLPSDNVILLLKENNELSRVARADQFDMETFGGNIHTLFSKAFFLDDSTVSRFAKDKIKNDIIKPLQSESPVESRLEISKLINKVGEPVLNLALRELYNKRYDSLQ